MAGQKVAIVTAASRGMGAACARQLAASGYSLMLFARSEELRVLAKELDADALTGSVASEADLRMLVGHTLAQVRHNYSGLNFLLPNWIVVHRF